MKSDAPADLALRPLRRTVAGTLLAIFSVFLGGCATSYEVRVSSTAKLHAAAPTSYRMIAANDDGEDTLRHREVAGYVRTALAGRGLHEAAPGHDASLTISLDYGVGPPVSRPELVSEPVYVYLPGRYRYERVQAGTDRNGNPVYQMVAVQEPPRTEFAGYSEYWITVTTYEKYLRLKAVENRAAPTGNPPAEIWNIDITSNGESPDLRKALPILAAASIDYVGQDSKGPKKVRLKDTDHGIAAVKKGT
jgi:hypothetical protein